MGVRRAVVLALAVSAASCGRLGFDQHATPATTPDAGAAITPDGATDAAALLACGAPQRFQIGLSLSGMAVVPTLDGFTVVTIDSSNNLAGWRYQLSGSQLAAVAENVALGGNANGTLGATSVGNDVVLAVSNGSPATSTTLYGLATDLTQLASPSVRTADRISDTPIAANGPAIAYATLDTSSNAWLRLVATNGTDLTTPISLSASSTTPSQLAVIAGGSGFAATSANGSQEQIALYDAALNQIAGPVTIPAVYAPRLAWASQSNAYLVAWHQKDVTNDDDVWGVVLGPNLQQLVAPFEIAPFSSNVVIASDGAGFWLTYDTYNPSPSHLASSYVATDGTITPRTVSSSGGSPNQWLMASRDGQSALVWLETGGSGPDLYFDPMCGH